MSGTFRSDTVPRFRHIIFSVECEEAAKALGGFEKIDPALSPVWDGLSRNPYGFDTIQTDYSNVARYVVTKEIGAVPSLVWLYRIEESGSVEIVHVEKYEGY